MINVNESEDGTVMTLTMPEKFDFSVHKDFRSSYQNSTARNYVVDLQNTSYMDSAALGMLLQLREHAGGENDVITLKNVSGNIREILDIVNFGQLMQVN